MSKGQFGARDLEKHLWKLDIREYDPAEPTHKQLAQLGQQAAIETAKALADLQARLVHEGRSFTWRIARRELRDSLAKSTTGQKIETLVAQLNI